MNHFPKTFSQVAQIFAKQSNTKKDHRPEYGVKIILNLNLQREYCCALVYLIIRQAPRAGKMNQIARCDWLPERKMEPSCPLGTTRCILQEKLHRKPYNKSFIDQICSVKMAVYRPRSFFASLWTSTSSRSINTQKKNLANIQPS